MVGTLMLLLALFVAPSASLSVNPHSLLQLRSGLVGVSVGAKIATGLNLAHNPAFSVLPRDNDLEV